MEIFTEQFDELTAPQQQTLIEFFRNSPLLEPEFDFERVPDYGRDISLMTCSHEIASLALNVAQRVWHPNYRKRVNECYRLIYKRGCQGQFSPSTGRRRYFLAFQPRA